MAQANMDSCIECGKEDDAHMVCCSTCEGNYHWDCARVTAEEAQLKWSCKRCSAFKSSEEPVALSNNNHSPESTNSKASSKRSSRLKKQMDLVNEELALVNEKCKLLQRREELLKKRALLQEDSSDSDSASTVSTVGGRCADWLRDKDNITVRKRSEITAATDAATVTPNLQSSNQCTTKEIEDVVEQVLRRINLTGNNRPQNESTSHWAPGLYPMSSTAHISNVVFEDNHLPSNIPQFRLSREQIAARKGLAKDLPTFTGKPEEWPLFMATYEQTTRMCGFSDEENLIRLRHALDGAAHNAVKSLLLNAVCVPQILSTLKMKYGRPELIIDVLLNQIRDMPPPKESKLETIVDFAIEVQNVCATMKAAGMTNYLNNPELQQELVSKLPGLLRAFWGMHKSTLVTCNLENFSEWLFDLAKGANCVIMPSCSTKSNRRGGSINTHIEGVNNLQKMCEICNGECANISSCDRFIKMKRNDKWKEIRKRHLCKICLLPHYPQPCTSGVKCNVDNCNMDHHPLLHKKHHLWQRWCHR